MLTKVMGLELGPHKVTGLEELCCPYHNNCDLPIVIPLISVIVYIYYSDSCECCEPNCGNDRYGKGNIV